MITDLTGQQFGSYRLVRRLGVGGFANVYLGQHVRISSKQAAIKILHLFDVDIEQFRREAETTERLVHPNIVRLLDFDIQQGTPFLILDYAPGGSLRTRHPKGSQVPLATVIEYLKEIVPALQHAHDQHILHGDIKPDNILIGRQGELLLSDFGTALFLRYLLMRGVRIWALPHCGKRGVLRDPECQTKGVYFSRRPPGVRCETCEKGSPYLC